MDASLRRKLIKRQEEVEGSIRRDAVLKRAAEVARRFADENVNELHQVIERRQEELRSSKGPLNNKVALLALDRDVFAVLALRTIFRQLVTAGSAPPTYSAVAKAIGDACYLEWIKQKQESNEYAAVLCEHLLSRYAENNRNRHSNVQKHIANFSSRDWSVAGDTGPVIGGILLDCAEEVGIVVIRNGEDEDDQSRRVELCREFRDALMEAPEEPGHAAIWGALVGAKERPMVCPPVPWQGVTGGGFRSAEDFAFETPGKAPEIANLIRHRGQPVRLWQIEKAAHRKRLDRVYNAVNALQAAPWRLNQRIYAVMRRVWDSGTVVPGEEILPDRALLSYLHREVLPLEDLRTDLLHRGRDVTRLYNQAAKEWDFAKHQGVHENCEICDIRVRLEAERQSLSEGWDQYYEQRGKVEIELRCGDFRDLFASLRYPLKSARLLRRSLEGKAHAFELQLRICDQVQADARDYCSSPEQLQLYFPYYLDYRGRLYPSVGPLNPQGNDQARALLEFAHGKPLGDEGERWLAIHLANTYGEDKASLDDRARWWRSHEETIRELVQIADSQGEVDLGRLTPPTLKFWSKADEPWQFLAACFEWERRNEPGFVSHIPVTLDASANGLQHLGALAREADCCRLTNLAPQTPQEEPQDLYQHVADALIPKLESQAENGEQLQQKVRELIQDLEICDLSDTVVRTLDLLLRVDEELAVEIRQKVIELVQPLEMDDLDRPVVRTLGLLIQVDEGLAVEIRQSVTELVQVLEIGDLNKSVRDSLDELLRIDHDLARILWEILTSKMTCDADLEKNRAAASWISGLTGKKKRRRTAQVTEDKERDLVEELKMASRALSEARFAALWSQTLDRKLVKKAVMTVPYGATESGTAERLANYVLEERREAASLLTLGRSRDACRYLANLLTDEFKAMFPGVYEVRRWLRLVAPWVGRHLGRPVTWETELGFPVVLEEYIRPEPVRVRWTDNDLREREYPLRCQGSPDTGLAPAALRTGIVPNLIHALDKTHLMLTIEYLHDRGVRHFTAIHDCYGVHASDIPLMRDALRKTFLELHRRPLLEDFLDQIIQSAEMVEVPWRFANKLRELAPVEPEPEAMHIDDVLYDIYPDVPTVQRELQKALNGSDGDPEVETLLGKVITSMRFTQVPQKQIENLRGLAASIPEPGEMKIEDVLESVYLVS